MIEARAIVRGVDGKHIRLKGLNPGNCARCARGQGCGGGILSRLLSRTRPDLRVPRPAEPELHEGDLVVLGLEEQALLSASVWVYLVPLTAMLAAGALAERVFGAPDPVVMLFALIGLIGGLAWLGRRGGAVANDERFRPVILRKDPSAAEHCARFDPS